MKLSLLASLTALVASSAAPASAAAATDASDAAWDVAPAALQWDEVSDEEWNDSGNDVSMEDRPRDMSPEQFRRLLQTAAPTDNPTPAPVISPASILAEATTETSNGGFEITITGTGLTINDVRCDADVPRLKTAVCDQLCASAGINADECSCTITDMDLCGKDVGRKLREEAKEGGLRTGERKLQTATGQLLVQFVLDIIAYCDNSALDDPCDAARITAIVDVVADKVETNLNAALANTGGSSDFITALKNTATQSTAVTTAFAAAVASGTIATSLNVSKIVAAAIALFNMWYPDWHGSTQTCKADGNAPLYMKKTGNFIQPSLEKCCTQYYSWDFTKCMIEGGADASVYETKEFFVDYSTDSCVQSCDPKTPGNDALNCGGLAPSWKATFDTADDCCDKTLFWVEQSACRAKSTGVAVGTGGVPAGTGKWWVKWDDFQCVKDCPTDSGDPQCGGLAKRWNELYASGSACCSGRLSWVDREDCTRA